MPYKISALITLILSSSTTSANFLKDLNQRLHDTIASTSFGRDYGLITAATTMTPGGIYMIYQQTAHSARKKELATHKKRFSYHEQLQDHYDHMLELTATYDSYTNPSLSHTEYVAYLCSILSHNQSLSQLEQFHRVVTKNLSTLSTKHKKIMTTFDTLKNSQQHAPLYHQKEHFYDTYYELYTLLSVLSQQLPYVEAKKFLETHKELYQELGLTNLSYAHFANNLNDLIHSRHHGSSTYPYRSYLAWLAPLKRQISQLSSALENFEPLPFQEETLQTVEELSQTLATIITRVKGSAQYKKECKAYEEECRRLEEEQRRRAQEHAVQQQRQAEQARKAAAEKKRLAVEQQKLAELKKQPNLMRNQQNQYTTPPPRAQNNQRQGPVPSAPPLDPYAAPPTYQPTNGPKPSAPTLKDVES